MATEAAGGMELGHAVALLAAGVVAVPIFRKLGLGAVLGYLAAGVAVGPFGFRLFNDPEAIVHVAELGCGTSGARSSGLGRPRSPCVRRCSPAWAC